MQALLGALNYYSRFIQNMGIYGAVFYQLKKDNFLVWPALASVRESFELLKQSIVKAPTLRHFDQGLAVHVLTFANYWALSSSLMQLHDNKLNPVRFCSSVKREWEEIPPGRTRGTCIIAADQGRTYIVCGKNNSRPCEVLDIGVGLHVRIIKWARSQLRRTFFTLSF